MVGQKRRPHTTGGVFENQRTSGVEFVELRGLLLKVAVKGLRAKLDLGNLHLISIMLCGKILKLWQTTFDV